MYGGNDEGQERGAAVLGSFDGEFEACDGERENMEMPAEEAAEVAEFLTLHKISEAQVEAMFGMEFDTWDALNLMQTEDIMLAGVALGRARVVVKAIQDRANGKGNGRGDSAESQEMGRHR